MEYLATWLQRGRCHPTDGCQDGDGFRGADFQYLAANVTDKRNGLPILPPIAVRLVRGVPVGFVGMTPETTPTIVNPAGITTVDFRDEVKTANLWGGVLRLFGVKALVLLIHQGGAQIALMNPGGIRSSLTFANSPGGEAPGDVTFGECFTVQPFNNLVVTQTFTGAQLKDVLEQQFVGFGGQTVQRILQPSAGFTYSYDTTRAPGDRVSAMALGGVPIDPAASYQVTTNDFLANGGDGFTNLTAGTGRVIAPGFYVDALVAYLGAGAPVAPGPANRITKLG